jgi:CheY-like chemotaxis protein
MSSLQPLVVIDDHHEDLFILKRLLIRAGVKNPFVSFDHADAAKRFLEAAMRTPETQLIPVAICCDKRMPGCDGFEFLKWVRHQPALATMPFYLLTSAVEPKDRERAAKFGATQFLEKFPSEQFFADLFGSKRGKSR